MSVVDLGHLTLDQGFRITGGGTLKGVGLLASTGDINGDGFDDLIIGTSALSYVVFGKESAFTDISLYTMPASAGIATYESSVAAGDVNGDGFDDLISSVQGGYEPGYGGSPAFARVRFGSSLGTGFSINSDAYAIGPVGSAGDINGDGFDDLLVGDAYGYSSASGKGAAFVIFGKASGFTTFNLSGFAASDGFKITGAAANQFAGKTLSSAGDVNGDGFDDIIICAPRDSSGGQFAGAAYVIFGKQSGLADIDLATLSSTAGYRITGEAELDGLGYDVASAGDINGDGLDDIVISSVGSDTGGNSGGAAYVIFGKASGSGDIDLTTLAAGDGFRIIGEAAYDNAGFSVSAAGDFNGDGFEDLIVGAPSNQPYGKPVGAAYIIFGHAGGFTDIDLSSLGESEGLKIVGGDPGDGLGTTVSAAGDINHDGFDDVMVAATRANAGGVIGGGEVFILYGHADAPVVKGGTDAGETVAGGNLDDTLDGRGGNDIVLGLGGNDTLVGGVGDDLLDGGTGADTMFGGVGYDTYNVDNAGDLVVERAGEGTDTVRSAMSYTLGANLENLLLLGAALNATGNSLDNMLTGNDGANTLDGNGGADTMAGGLGNDSYVVGAVGDVVIEAASAGTDLVKSSVSYTLGANLEKVQLTGTAALNANGNSLNNIMNGNSGNNVLDGNGGADIMAGALGNDTYVVDNMADVASEASATGGTDLVKSSVSFTLGANVEKLQLTGSTAINGTGNGLDNSMNGNSGANVLSGLSGSDVISGAAGNDTLKGGLGNDQLTGGADADKFEFDTALGATNVDKITDFTAVDDTIVLARSIFSSIAATGTLSAASFFAGTAAHDADDRVIYDNATGHIWYDADGNGAGAAILFAQVNPGAGMTNVDFLIVA